MDESQFSQPALPPKRKAPLMNKKSAAELSELQGLTKNSQENNMLQEEEILLDDVDPELLSAFEQAVKDTPLSVDIDISVPLNKNLPTAPILEGYIDPFSIPIEYLLEQARKLAVVEDAPENSLEPGSNKVEKSEK